MGLVRFFQRKDREKTIKKLMGTVREINALESKYEAMSDEELISQTEILKGRYKAGEKLDDLLCDAFAVVREASKRVLNMRHFDVQMVGGIVLHQGRIAEMKTGEGKTLVATLPAYLNALTGEGVHIVTVNDYLAKRDAEWMGKVYTFLGMTVGCVLPQMDFASKKAAYDADITYCTNNEVGFDYLRDNMATRKDRILQRGHHFAIVDEVDSILIDEARTPLIISDRAAEATRVYEEVQNFIKILNEDDYSKDEKEAHIYLTESGLNKADKFFRADLSDTKRAELNTKINNALRANFLMARDTDYIVENGEVVIVDEFTGRKMEGRRFSDGLHQAIEAKEKVRIKRESRTVATITFQNLFRLYKKLSGMTGTAMTEEAEFKGIYNLDVVEIPTNHEMIRVDEPDKVFATKEGKFKAVVEEVKAIYNKKQPVLVGTISVEVSEQLSRMLMRQAIPHRVLNAKSNELEAGIIAQAGRVGAVTIATNMAGRGTDILLGGNPEYLARERMKKDGYEEDLINIASAFNHITDEKEVEARTKYHDLVKQFKEETDKEREIVKQLGGLRVIGTERHESRRIDNQLRGRSGRQGDEGSSCFYISFEDDLLRKFGGDRLSSLLTAFTKGDDEAAIQMPMLSKQIENAQKRCEDANFERRKYVLNYDDVMNKQRQLIYAERQKVFNGEDVHDQILKYIEPSVADIVTRYVDYSSGDETTVDYEAFNGTLERFFLKKGSNFVTPELVGHRQYDRIVEEVTAEAQRQYEEKCAFMQEHGFDYKDIERQILLRTVDSNWMNHIDNMETLRRGIGLRGLGQRDPVIEYRREGTDMFDGMIETIQNTVAVSMCKLNIEEVVEKKEAQDERVEQQSLRRQGVFANSPCPCGSGKRYKDCCGKKNR